MLYQIRVTACHNFALEKEYAYTIEADNRGAAEEMACEYVRSEDPFASDAVSNGVDIFDISTHSERCSATPDMFGGE